MKKKENGEIGTPVSTNWLLCDTMLLNLFFSRLKLYVTKETIGQTQTNTVLAVEKRRKENKWNLI